MEQTLVTVLMPVFNGELFLKEAIESILHQTYTNIEFLIINDGSTDKTLDIINLYDDKRIRLISFEKNQGLITILNVGLREAKGKYIARMDADDVAYPERIEKQFEVFKKYPELTICSTHMSTNKKSSVYFKSILNSDEIKSRLLFDNLICHPTVMYKSALFIDSSHHYKMEFPHAEDYALWLDFIEKGKFYIIPKTLLKYREHNAQISKTNRLTQIDSVIKAQLTIFNKLVIKPSHEELLIHSKIFFIDYNYNLTFLIEVEKWLLKLKKQNQKTNIFNSTAFENILSWTWFEICTDIASKKYRCQKFFKNSELYNFKVYSKYYLVKFELKNLIVYKKL